MTAPTASSSPSAATQQMPVLCIASSLLQKAAFLASRHAARPHLLIGNRGISGDVSYDRSVLNDHSFLNVFDALVARQPGPVELFIPNALNIVYYYGLAHPKVVRISFTDEGMLTNRFLGGGYRKPAARGLDVFSAAFALARSLPGPARAFGFRVIAWIIKRVVGVRYESDTVNYPFRTIELSRKGGVVLSHSVPAELLLPWAENVDLTRDVRVPMDCEDAACLFVHPKQVTRPEQIDALFIRIAEVSDRFTRGLLKPHPLFSEFPSRLKALNDRLTALGMPWATVELSGRYETAIELYARGVRLFIVGPSSVTVTVASYPDYFSDLTLVEI